MEAPKDSLLAKHDKSGAESPKTAHDVKSEEGAEIKTYGPRHALGKYPGIKEEKGERHHDNEEKEHLVAKSKPDAHARQRSEVSQSRSLLPVTSIKTSSNDGVAISRLTSSLPSASRCFTRATIACGGRWQCRT